jgi:hypothetical protein
MKRILLFIGICIAWIGSTSIHAQDSLSMSAPQEISLFDHLWNYGDSLPSVALDTDWKQLIRKKRRKEYQSLEMHVVEPDSSLISFKGKVRSRGNMRKEVCYYPPVKIKLKKKELAKNGFSDMNELKMVIQCKKGKIGESYLLKEALVYKLHEIIGPNSYQTKVVRLNLMKEKNDKDAQLLGFFIEHEEEIADRLNGRVIEEGRIADPIIDRDSYLKMCFFQYMILNTDWYIPNKHNLEFIKIEGEQNVQIIPYDFDYCGMVGTAYATPHTTRPIETVMEPYFDGKNVTEEEARNMAAYFLSKKEELLATCRNFTLLEERKREEVERQLMDFFKTLENEKLVLRVFVSGN